jgi:predicted RND superfamily exporter protein
MSLGISVDYSAHIMHEFLECKGDREKRVEITLTQMGPAILHASLSTFLGVCFTILGAGFVWKAFFTIWSAVVFSGFI